MYINDAPTPEALNLCLSNIKEQFGNKNISIVLGCGGNRDRSKDPIIGKIDTIIVTEFV